MSYNITVEGGKSVRLPTKGKYCDRDIVVTATGGGGSVETCTVTIKSQNGYAIRRYFANLYTNGVTCTCSDVGAYELKLENVVCGSSIYFVTGSMIAPSYSVSGGAAHVYHESMTKCDWGFSAPTTANASATITVWDDD